MFKNFFRRENLITEKVIFVGVKKDYGSIQSAIKAAEVGDIIAIDPDIYKENVVINKLVHLRANIDNPEKGKVVIHGRDNIPLVFDYLPVQKETIYVEGLKLVRNAGSCQKLCLIANSNFDLSIIFNRCRILAGVVQYPISISDHICTDRVIIEQCYLERGRSYLSRFVSVRNNYSAIIKTELNTSFVSNLCKDR
ncbi:unnamed protein product, partial [marine sediment metagenome]